MRLNGGKNDKYKTTCWGLQRRQRDFDTHRIFCITVIDFSKERRWVDDINYFQPKTLSIFTILAPDCSQAQSLISWLTFGFYLKKLLTLRSLSYHIITDDFKTFKINLLVGMIPQLRRERLLFTVSYSKIKWILYYLNYDTFILIFSINHLFVVNYKKSEEMSRWLPRKEEIDLSCWKK